MACARNKTVSVSLKRGAGDVTLTMPGEESLFKMDGKSMCMILAVEANGHDLLTIEGLPHDDPVIEAFTEQCEPGHGTALQCGYCTPGFVMTTRALLNETPNPTLDETREALSGNLCRCGCYAGIAMAVKHASEKIAARGGQA